MAEPGGHHGRGRASRDAAAEVVRRLCGARPTWSALFAGLALLGLIVMPVDYRGGATQPHTHSLLQLVLDASDGMLLHDHAAPMLGTGGAEHRSWFDPSAPVTFSDHATADGATHLDMGTTHGSVGSYFGIPFLLAALVTVTVAVSFGTEISSNDHRPRGRIPETLCPPPRVAVVA